MEFNNTIKNIVLTLVILGLSASLYLTYDHYSSKSSACDFTATVSCSLVNSSIYSELFHVPVAILGLLWFLFALYLVLKMTRQRVYVGTFFIWTLIGIISVIYLVWAEIKLGALCPVCTLVHGILIALLVVSVFLYIHYKEDINLTNSIVQIKWWLIGGLFLILVLSYLFQGQQNQEERTNLAQCLTQNGVRMYGSYTCSHCLREKQLFGDAFKFINYIECHPQGPNPQTNLCDQKDIKNTPTWTIEINDTQTKREVGYLDIEELKAFGGC